MLTDSNVLLASQKGEGCINYDAFWSRFNLLLLPVYSTLFFIYLPLMRWTIYSWFEDTSRYGIINCKLGIVWAACIVCVVFFSLSKPTFPIDTSTNPWLYNARSTFSISFTNGEIIVCEIH